MQMCEPGKRASMALRGFFGIVLLAPLPDLHAQGVPQEVPPPYDGVHFDASRPGVGLWLDTGPDGTTFGALMHYAFDGRPTFSTFASPLVRGADARASRAALRTIAGPLFESVDGQCLGCAWRPPRSSPLAGLFNVEVGHRDAQIRVGLPPEPQAVPILDTSAMLLGRSDDELLEGVWWLALGAGPDTDGALNAIVRLVPAPALSRDASIETMTPPSRTFEVTCVSSCGDFESWRTLGGPHARVLAFADKGSELLQDAAIGRYVGPDQALLEATGTRIYRIRLGPFLSYSMESANGAPRLVMYRTPIVGPCDSSQPCPLYREAAYGDELPVDTEDRLTSVLGGQHEITGAYFDPTQPGTGLWIDAGRDGETFMTLMTYRPRPDGGSDPVFYTLGGPLTLGYISFVAIPTVISPLYESRDGQRLDGPWRAPATRVATELGEARVRIYGPDFVELTVAGHKFAMVAMRPDRPVQDVPAGSWFMMQRDQERNTASGQRTQARTATLRADIRAASIARSGIADARSNQPSSQARTYVLQCATSCGDFDGLWRGAAVGVWVEPDGRGILSEVAQSPRANGYTVPADARQFVLALGDDTIEGYALGQRGDGTGDISRLRLHRNPSLQFCDNDATCP